ncbi:lipopolysaccharide biosynthesis protein [Sinomonas terrae]|uniref:MATE family efflux transporter n=1 Tax=Sinomonas terrae TaxID=2908838 RepID=A0ABS9U5F6_9MICC|nr:MATE family efflux transporter [Sinomonas terrae]MCH6471806.1 MATE family efflux transporter [Sinomonas terrae]
MSFNDRPLKQSVWIVNGAANLVRAASGSLENLLLPLVLLWLLPKEKYGAWAIVFSVSTYVTYLDLGLQTAVQTNVARCAGSNDLVGAARMAWTGVKLAGSVGGLALTCLATVAATLARIFPAVPQGFVPEAEQALVLLAVGQVANLLINVMSSYYAGHQRSVLPSLVMSGARATSLLAVILVGNLEKQLPALAAAYSVPLITGFLVLLIAFHREFRYLRELRRVSRGSNKFTSAPLAGSRAGHLLRYSGPLMIWNICTLVVNAAGTAIVGRVDFGAVVVYSIATMFVLAIVGVDNAVMSPLLTELGRQASFGDRPKLGSTAIKASRINSAILGMLICFSCITVAILADTAPGSGINSRTIAIAVLLIVATATRITMTPLTFAFISTGDHRRIVAQPILDAVINLGLSISLGLIFGVVGVVLGAVASGGISVVINVSWSRRAARFNDVVSGRNIARAVGQPMICTLPAIVTTLISPVFAPLGTLTAAAIVVMAALLSFSMLWFLALPADIRASLVRGLITRRRIARV